MTVARSIAHLRWAMRQHCRALTAYASTRLFADRWPFLHQRIASGNTLAGTCCLQLSILVQWRALRDL